MPRHLGTGPFANLARCPPRIGATEGPLRRAGTEGAVERVLRTASPHPDTPARAVSADASRTRGPNLDYALALGLF